MEQTRYLISDAAKQVEVESHVLRYWEEELGIPIKRNELGHRYYTQEDVDRFREIKKLKEQGLQLKAIRMVLKDGKLERLSGKDMMENIIDYGNSMSGEKAESGSEKNADHESYINQDKHMNHEEHMIEIVGTRAVTGNREESREEKSMRLQILLQHMIREAVKDNNRELCEDIRQCVLKELDYQFRQQEEKEEERETERRKREEEHYKKIDELLRSYSKKGKKKKEREKTRRFGAKKKPSIV